MGYLKKITGQRELRKGDGNGIEERHRRFRLGG